MDRRYELLGILFEMMNSGATSTRALKLLVRGLKYAVDFVEDIGPRSNLREPREDSEALHRNTFKSSFVLYH
ncbi:hypothetical protein PoB_001552900 [Plakobranchus ocellatus]|uniref:Uncharacterized protein n=1 Tax=Plakobranchus ocellatus TaxID=259542 RepID=A0AAV3Z144_9GAST|nr:hypothetical protein PoB_001552900 [Plakobranchus ocellatus]